MALNDHDAAISRDFAATSKELEAAFLNFEGAMWRGDAKLIQNAAEGVRAATERRMDAQASLISTAKRAGGL